MNPTRLLIFGLTTSLIGTTLMGCPRFEEGNDLDRPDTSLNDGGDENQVEPGTLCEVDFEFREAQDAFEVAISGEFNDWSIDADSMSNSSGAWRHTLELAPGNYGFKYVIDGSYEGSPPPFVYTKWVGDSENRNLIVEDCTRPSLELQTLEVSPAGLVEAQLLFHRGLDDAPLDESTLEISLGGQDIPATVSADQISISYELADHGKYSLRASARDEVGRNTLQNPLWVPLWHEEEEFHWFDSIMYLIFTDRFQAAGGARPLPPVDGVEPIANYQGGNFKGITEAIEDDYFDEMGVNLLWLNPINENTDNGESGSFDDNVYTGYHGYWTIDPLKAETRYGDGEISADERLHEMIEAAHDRGIRVIFDLVLNHVHEDHSYCDSNPAWCATTCVCGGENCGWDERTLDCQFAPYLPNLNYRNHDIVEQVIADVMIFMETYDIDGVRIDAAKHMEHVIMRTVRLRLNELEEMGAAPFYVVGETFTGEDGHGEIMEYVADWELHGQFDFPLLYPMRRVFGQGASFQELETGLTRSENAYGSTYPWHSPFVGNHDIPRFVTEMVGNGEGGFGSTPDLMAEGPANSIDQQWIIDRLSMANAFLLTIPGIPLLYYGDEIGLAGDSDPDNRRMMQWDRNANQQALLERVQELGQIRRSMPALRYGSRQELWIDQDFYAFARDEGEHQALVAMNKAEDQRTEIVTLPEDWSPTSTLVDQLSGTSITATDGEVEIGLDAWGYAIFEVSP